MGTYGRLFCHLCNCVMFFLTFVAMLLNSGINPLTFAKMYTDTSKIDPWEAYGVKGCIALYFCQLIVLISFPQALFNFGGIIFYKPHPDNPASSHPFPKLPLICFRVVTRGTYPELVRHNVNHNLETCLDVGLDNFIIEVVTDQNIQLPFNSRTREVVVPFNYCTKNGVLFKARALQYALEDGVNTLGDDDWIVHLDEETLLTESSLKGVVRLAVDNNHSLGQGLITYGKRQIVNWLLTLCDSSRCADDLAKLRFQFLTFHKPYYGWKCSFIIAKVKAEKDVSFDHGIESSIAEDCFFAMVAFHKEFTFGFIEGEMWEKSPFTFMDFIRQRKRWVQGILLTVHSPLIPFNRKILLALSVYSWISMPIACSNIFLGPLYPVQLPMTHNVVVAFVGSTGFYMSIYGALVCFSARRLGIGKFVACIIGSIVFLPLKVVLETIALTWGVFSNKLEFYVVNKHP